VIHYSRHRRAAPDPPHGRGLYAPLSAHGAIDADELEQTCLVTAGDDEAGQDWCEENGFAGYTSYASVTDLPWRYPIFGDLVKALNKHVADFAADAGFDLGDKKLVLEDIWINILPEGGIHTSHIHPHSVISGTTYVAMPEGASAIKFEDPRLAMMMAALRHEVPMNDAEDERISVSFNYRWE